MMRILTAMSLCAVMAASAMAVAPSAVFLGDGPGVNAPFLDDGELVTYGVKTHVGGFSFDGTGGSTDNWGLLRYRPSLASDPGNHVSMPADQDWVFEISFKQEVGFGTEGPFYFKDEDADKRILGITNHRDGTYTIKAAPQGSNDYVDLATVNLPLGEWGDFVYHYKADTGLCDAYFNGDLVAGDFEIQSAGGSWVQGEWQRYADPGTNQVPTTTSFRNIMLGQIPEPATMLILTLGACVGLARRRR